MMYSDVPRSLIYKDIESISDVIGSSSEPSLEREFFNRLVKRPFMKDASNPQRCVYTVFNNAIYISTLIILDEGSSISANIYINKAAEGVNDAELKSHIAAATMALVYNWLGIHVRENNLLSIELKDIPLLKDNIRKYFDDENSSVASESKEDFNTLIIVDSTLNTSLDEEYFVLRDITDITNCTCSPIPIEDIAMGIDYILEIYGAGFNNNSESRDFLSRILERFEEEKSLVADTHILDSAIAKVKSERQRLKYAPDEEGFSLSLDNMHKFSDFSDGTLEAYTQDSPATSGNSTTTQEAQQQPTLAAGEEEQEEWDNRYDGFLKENLNAKKIYEALQKINSPFLPKSERGYWWTLYKVLFELNWVRGNRGDQKTLLQWANHHFKLGWDWSKKGPFKFGEVPNNEIIRKNPIFEWKNGGKRVDYYGELADRMIDTFQIFTDNGCNQDNQAFFQPGKRMINRGLNTLRRR